LQHPKNKFSHVKWSQLTPEAQRCRFLRQTAIAKTQPKPTASNEVHEASPGNIKLNIDSEQRPVVIIASDPPSRVTRGNEFGKMEEAPEHDNTTTDVELTQTDDAEADTNPLNTLTTSTQETINPKTRPITDSENVGAAHIELVAKPHLKKITTRM
jgi:hypothetical protein